MEDRDFNEVDLREMLDHASRYRPDVVEGRFIGETMKDRYLEVTFRKGKALAAYLYLPRPAGVKSVRTEPADRGLLVDYGLGGEPIGLVITAPAEVTLEGLNAVLTRLGQPPLGPEEVTPLQAA